MTEMIDGDGNVSFKSDEYIWNAYGKDDVDQENLLTYGQWREFVRQYGKGMSDGVVDWENISTEFDKFCEKYEEKAWHTQKCPMCHGGKTMGAPYTDGGGKVYQSDDDCINCNGIGRVKDE